MPRFRCPWHSNPKSYPFRLHSGGEVHGQSPLVAVCGLLSAFVGPILRTLSNIATCPSKSDKWWFEKPQESKRRDHPERDADFYAWFSQPWRPSLCKLTVSRFVFRHKFSATKWKFTTPLSDVFDIHARLAIYFYDIDDEFQSCIAFCVQKPNNCANFALRGNAQRELHYKRLPSQD